MRGAVKKTGAPKFNKLSSKNSPASVQPQMKQKFLNSLHDDSSIKNSKMRARMDQKRNSKITLLVRDDAWIQDKDICKNDCINQPIPGLIVQTQFQREKAQLSERNYWKEIQTVIQSF